MAPDQIMLDEFGHANEGKVSSKSVEKHVGCLGGRELGESVGGHSKRVQKDKEKFVLRGTSKGAGERSKEHTA